MKVVVAYDSDGSQEMVLEGPRITVHPGEGRSRLFRVWDDAGTEVVRAVGVTLVYWYDLDRTAAVPDG